MQLETVTTSTTASAGHWEAGRSRLSTRIPTAKPNSETTMPLAITGRLRPKISITRFAGVARMGDRVPNCRSLAIVIVAA